MVTLAALGFRVKTLDHSGLVGGGVLRRYPLGGVVVEPRHLGLVSLSSVASLVLLVYLFPIFDLLCKRFPSSHCIGSAVVDLFIKRGYGLFRLFPSLSLD